MFRQDLIDKISKAKKNCLTLSEGIKNYQWIMENCDSCDEDSESFFAFRTNGHKQNTTAYFVVNLAYMTENRFNICLYDENECPVFDFLFCDQPLYNIQGAFEIVKELKEFMYDFNTVLKTIPNHNRISIVAENEKHFLHKENFRNSISQRKDLNQISIEMTDDFRFSVEVRWEFTESLNSLFELHKKYKDSRFEEPKVNVLADVEGYMDKFRKTYGFDDTWYYDEIRIGRLFEAEK